MRIMKKFQLTDVMRMSFQWIAELPLCHLRDGASDPSSMGCRLPRSNAMRDGYRTAKPPMEFPA